jgi:hypothetical protein
MRGWIEAKAVRRRSSNRGWIEAMKELHHIPAMRSNKKPAEVVCIGLEYFNVVATRGVARRC